MRCHGCDSSDHLIGRCPTKGDGSKGGKDFFSAEERSVSFVAASSNVSGPTTGPNSQVVPHLFFDLAGHWQTDEQRLADNAGGDTHGSPHAVYRFGRQFAHASPPQRTYERYALSDGSDDEENDEENDDMDEANASEICHAIVHAVHTEPGATQSPFPRCLISHRDLKASTLEPTLQTIRMVQSILTTGRVDMRCIQTQTTT